MLIKPNPIKKTRAVESIPTAANVPFPRLGATGVPVTMPAMLLDPFMDVFRESIAIPMIDAVDKSQHLSRQ